MLQARDAAAGTTKRVAVTFEETTGNPQSPALTQPEHMHVLLHVCAATYIDYGMETKFRLVRCV
jgi:hypothetical protein